MRTNDGVVEKKSYVFEMLKALIVALIITLVMVLAAALIIKLFNLPTESISIVNQVIKGVSIFVSALICLRLKNCGFIRGIIWAFFTLRFLTSYFHYSTESFYSE